MKPLILVLLLATFAQAEIVAYRFADGNLYVNTASGPEKIKIVDLPTDGPTDPDKPKTDKFGLIKVSKEAADKVADYANKDDHRNKLSAYYTALATSVESGAIPQDKLSAAVDLTFTQAVGSDSSKWQPWKDATTTAFNAAPIDTKEDAAQGLKDIGVGLVPEGDRAVDWAALIKFFVEVILPLIIKLIGSGG